MNHMYFMRGKYNSAGIFHSVEYQKSKNLDMIEAHY